MIKRYVKALMLFGTAANAALLPLKHGTYVLASTPCRDPALAAIFTYDGRHFSYAHASACNSVIVSQASHKYWVRETCSALGDGTAAALDTTVSTYETLSLTKVRVSDQAGHKALLYRWCGARQVNSH